MRRLRAKSARGRGATAIDSNADSTPNPHANANSLAHPVANAVPLADA